MPDEEIPKLAFDDPLADVPRHIAEKFCAPEFQAQAEREICHLIAYHVARMRKLMGPQGREIW